TLEVAKDAAFKEIVHAKQYTDASTSSLVLKDPGLFYWRATAYFYSNEYKASSRSQRFEIKKLKSLQAPVLIAPADKQSFPLTDKTSDTVTLEWKETPAADSYLVELTKTGGPSRQVKVDDIQYTLTNLKIGTYRWRVQAFAESDQKSQWSSVHQF